MDKTMDAINDALSALDYSNIKEVLIGYYVIDVLDNRTVRSTIFSGIVPPESVQMLITKIADMMWRRTPYKVYLCGEYQGYQGRIYHNFVPK